MGKYYYDLHIHSCLSPCADNDMTPNNIANMAALAGLNIVALTDHNTTLNCPAFFKAARDAGIIPVAGMELTTSEEIHIVCLFEKLDDAMLFNSAVERRRVPVANKTEIFGDQLIMDADDKVIGTEPNLLPIATTVSLAEAYDMVSSFNGICYPAHIDREANGIIAILGDFPQQPPFSYAELYDREKLSEYRGRFPILNNLQVVFSSDAHFLWAIRDKDGYFELDDDPYSSALIRERLFEKLRCK